ncbi:MAG: FKBP-type peptidyl-prolyl cis-trans isomerase FkpA [Myxococcota bacterium]|jgi:FKBP-type peptidyl-prolyl cis-trans isomerase FkpA
MLRSDKNILSSGLRTRTSITSVMCVLLLTLSAITASSISFAEEKKEDNVLYVIGVAVSQGLDAFALSDSELDTVLSGVRDGVTGAASHVNPRDYMPQIQALQGERQAAVAVAEKKKSAEFLVAAAKEPNTKTYDSGLILTTVSEGSGESPVATDMVKVHYRGTFIDGTVFDSSYDRGEPAQFPLTGVIKCWTEGVATMKTGGKARLVCPSDIAYGDGGRPGSIPGGATLAFDVELLEILPKK